MDPNTAAGAYGFTSYTPAQPGGLAIMPETQVGVTGNVPGAVLGKLGAHPAQNPLFWLLLIALAFTGYIYGGFDFGVKKVTKGSFRVGR